MERPPLTNDLHADLESGAISREELGVGRETEFPICPYCNATHDDWFDHALRDVECSCTYDGEVVNALCPECGHGFEFTICLRETYITTPVARPSS